MSWVNSNLQRSFPVSGAQPHGLRPSMATCQPRANNRVVVEAAGTTPTTIPTPPSPIMSKGARTPPEVPDPSDVDQMRALTNRNGISTRNRLRAGRRRLAAPMTEPSPWSSPSITSVPTPRGVRLKEAADADNHSAPSAGHHIQWILFKR